MRNNKVKSLTRRCITLIEIMIVMFLIAMITGVVAYNYRGSLEEGKAFKSKAGIEKLQTILSLVIADEPTTDLSGDNWKKVIDNSPLVQNSKALMKDGWGDDYVVESGNDNVVKVTSQKYNKYVADHPTTMFKQ